MTGRILVVLAIMISAPLIAEETGKPGEKPPFIPTSAYTQKTMSGFTVLISPELFKHPDIAGECTALLEEKLAELKRLVPAEKIAPVQQTKFWVEWEQLKKGAACAHHSVDWLTKNGYNPGKVHSIEISNARNFINWSRKIQPMMIVHEFSHIYHHGVLKGNNTEIKAAYDQALKSGKYDQVDYAGGGRKMAYGMNNASEYFAELTEAWFGRNDFYPFTREELKSHDPQGFALMEKAWGKPAE